MTGGGDIYGMCFRTVFTFSEWMENGDYSQDPVMMTLEEWILLSMTELPRELSSHTALDARLSPRL